MHERLASRKAGGGSDISFRTCIARCKSPLTSNVSPHDQKAARPSSSSLIRRKSAKPNMLLRHETVRPDDRMSAIKSACALPHIDKATASYWARPCPMQGFSHPFEQTRQSHTSRDSHVHESRISIHLPSARDNWIFRIGPEASD